MVNVVFDNEVEVQEMLLRKFDTFRRFIGEGGRWENEAEFLAERGLFDEFLESLDYSINIHFQIVEDFIWNKSILNFWDVSNEELEEYKENALFVSEKRQVLIMSV